MTYARASFLALSVALAGVAACVEFACYGEAPADLDNRPGITDCGLILRGADEATLARLRRQEGISLRSLESVCTPSCWDRKQTCNLIAGAEVMVSPLRDGGTWRDELWHQMPTDFDRGTYSGEQTRIVVTTDEWANPEFTWGLARLITRGEGDPEDTLWWTGNAIAQATNEGRDSSVDPLPPVLSGATGESQ